MSEAALRTSNPAVPWLILGACMIIGILNETSNSVISLGIGDAARDVHASAPVAQLTLLLAKLVMGALLVAAGGIGDRFGRKRVMLIGLGVVGGACLLSMGARDAAMLAASRALDGLGSAMIAPLALAISVMVFPEEMRARVVGIFLAVNGFGVAIGPILVGFAIELGGWREAFLVPVAIALLGGIVIARRVPPIPPAQGVRLDVMGMALCVVGLAGLVIGLMQVGGGKFLEPRALAPLAVGIAGLAGFAWWELRMSAAPLVPTAILTSGEILLLLAVMLVAAMVVSGTMVPMLYYLQRVGGLTPIGAVFHLSPLIAGAVVVGPLSGGLANAVGRKPVVVAGLALMAGGSAIMAFLTPSMSYPAMVGALVLLGGGMMAVATPAADAVLATSGEGQTGAAAAVNSAVLQVGGAIGLGAIVSVFIHAALRTFHDRLIALGYGEEAIRGPGRELIAALRDSAVTHVPRLPHIPAEMQADMLDAYSHAFAAGVGRSFTVSALLCLAAFALILFALPGRRRNPAAMPERE
ncbi:MAG: MFS transporter [Magnetospirillum sp.]|nr:MFS transporter [Magnetospirillum sp.]